MTSDDPITLEPHSSLSFPPFSLQGQYFDPVALSAYVVSRSKFENPLTRVPIAAEDCQRLDAHVSLHCAAFKWDQDMHNAAAGGGASRQISVFEAYLLYSRVRLPSSSSSSSSSSSADSSRRLDVLRSTAALVLQGLFSYDPWTPSSSSASSGDGTSYRVVDDGLAVAAASDAAAAASAASASARLLLLPSGEEHFPTMLDDEADKRASANARVALERLSLMKLHVDSAAAARMEEERGERVRAAARAEREARDRAEREDERKALKERHGLRIEEQREKEENERQGRDEARREIERWRADMFANATIIRDENLKKFGVERQEERAKKAQDEVEKVRGDKLEAERAKVEAESAKVEADELKAEREKEKRALKKSKEKDRAKAKKEAERKLEEERARDQALRERKDAAATKCSKCDAGILDAKKAFEKFGKLYCSSACAREAAPAGPPKEI